MTCKRINLFYEIQKDVKHIRRRGLFQVGSITATIILVSDV